MLDINIDLGALVNAITWPSLAGVLLMAYRKDIGKFIRDISPRINQLSVGPLSIGLTESKGDAIDFPIPGQDDLWQAGLGGIQSGVSDVQAQIWDTSKIDYVVFNLGDGKRWLSSRLFIFTKILHQIRGIKCVVFLANREEINKKFLGFVDSCDLSEALSRMYPWLDAAFAQEYENLFKQAMRTPNRSIDSNQATILVQNFMSRIRKKHTVTRLSSSLNPSPSGQQVTFTVEISPLTSPSSSKAREVTFYDGMSRLYPTIPLDPSGKARFSAILTVGSHTITAEYSGDDNQAPSADTIIQVVTDPNLPAAFTSDYPKTTDMQSSGSLKKLAHLSSNEYVTFESQISEHAEWIDEKKLEKILDDSLKRSYIKQRDLIGKSKKEQAKLALFYQDTFLVVVDEDQRFIKLINRQKLSNEIAKNVLEEMINSKES